MINSIEHGDLINWKPFVATTVWFSGCNTRCNYCHNPSLLIPKYVKNDWLPDIADDDYFVLLGGEPTISPQFKYLVDNLNKLGRKIKLFTNGLVPIQGDFTEIVFSIPDIYFKGFSSEGYFKTNILRYKDNSKITVRSNGKHTNPLSGFCIENNIEVGVFNEF